jgi:hypothetical protein
MNKIGRLQGRYGQMAAHSNNGGLAVDEGIGSPNGVLNPTSLSKTTTRQFETATVLPQGPAAYITPPPTAGAIDEHEPAQGGGDEPLKEKSWEYTPRAPT